MPAGQLCLKLKIPSLSTKNKHEFEVVLAAKGKNLKVIMLCTVYECEKNCIKDSTSTSKRLNGDSVDINCKQ